ncbi:MAG: ABC transporter substrate-binding protein [Syntrophales bacterium]|nr:ABC transporter substrate-binding protein [Syntrophales bacterium]MDD5643057.1 ABC transporter substrate-binding protein [Syntrophales bacterium]
MRLMVIRVLVLCLTLNLALAVSGVRAEGPTETVKGVVDEVIRILKDPSLKAQKKLRRDRVKQTVDRRFDYEEMARRSLGRNWRSLSAGQRAEFVRIFGELLEASYSDKIMNYSGEKVQYDKAVMDGPDYAEVRTVLLRKNDRIPMNYRMILKPQGWMVYDVVIEGVSLVSNYRSQFNRVIRESSYNELVRRLRVKIKELQRTKNI